MGARFATREAMSEATLAGTPDTVLRRIEAYRAAGVNAIDLKLLPLRTPDTLDQLRLLAGEVLPALAGRETAATAH
jgi:alkanesulfonate monooxygenase SsuD/methylene tetrahydromethanopterin reductase-like flavin-dependent oxidoreductase (luciferase family)